MTPRRPKKQQAILREEFCLGCGLCVRVCPEQALKLTTRGERVIPPLNSVHLTVAMAIERGKLQELLFDNHAQTSYRAMAAILGAILKLPPLKRAIASQQVKSRYLEALIRKFDV